MLQSSYILDILDLSFDELESEGLLRRQVSFLQECNYEHTGVGIYIKFLTDKEIEKYRIPTAGAQNFDENGNPTEMLIGVEIKNEELNILADATVHVTNGLIDRLEIWNKNG